MTESQILAQGIKWLKKLKTLPPSAQGRILGHLAQIYVEQDKPQSQELTYAQKMRTPVTPVK